MSILAIATLCLGSVPIAVIHRSINERAFTTDTSFVILTSLLRSTLGERFVIFGDPVVDGIPVHARREDSRFLVTWTGDVQNLRHFE